MKKVKSCVWRTKARTLEQMNEPTNTIKMSSSSSSIKRPQNNSRSTSNQRSLFLSPSFDSIRFYFSRSQLSCRFGLRFSHLISEWINGRLDFVEPRQSSVIWFTNESMARRCQLKAFDCWFEAPQITKEMRKWQIVLNSICDGMALAQHPIKRNWF